MTRPPAGKRDFTLLWASQTFSEFAYSTSLLALPLIVLTVTGSPSQAGFIGFVDAATMVLAGLPAGAVADRYDRRTVMLWCQAGLVLVFVGVAVALWAGAASLGVLAAFAVANGALTAVLFTTASAMVPSLVPEEELSGAVAANAARTYAGQLLGTSAGGFLQSMRNSLPFALGAVAHTVGLVVLLFLRPQPSVPRQKPRGKPGQELVEGIRWIAGQPFLRLGLLYATVANFAYGTVYFIVIASAKQSGMDSGLIGLMAALLGVGGLLGALVSPKLLRVLTGSRPVFLVLWLFGVLTFGIALLPGRFTPGVLLGVAAFAAPTASAYFTTHQLLLTPDSHRGRVMSVAQVSGSSAAAAPLVGGVAYDLAGRAPSLLACATVLVGIALSAVLSPVMRNPPRAAARDDEERGKAPEPSSAAQA
ncbi:MFS transporter [Streptomyces sp. CB03238]|uniref:MFS transporter n=1 Tax=Streptomyces sp. CB03238 TaxID=1907777 RepID=UPI000A102DA2|nr:MFS transporter [Streptomyces sp. CB03238]ORT57419.1 MFS transporter permease [Streptomyces sp. CB03238]